MADAERRTVPGQQSHHGAEGDDKVEHGVGHLALEDPVRIGWRITGNAAGGVGQHHNEVQCHTAQHDSPMDQRLPKANRIHILTLALCG